MSRVLVDSGIKWIGSLPSTWSITNVNKIFYRRKEVNDVENPTVLSLARDGVKIRDISTNEGQLAESYDNYHKVYKDDLMINPMDLVSGANCSLSEVEGVISPAYINLAKKENNIYPKYYDYFFKYQYWINGMFIHGKGVSFDNRWTINWETMSSYKLPFPKYEEQKRIANYLDKQCKKIDQIITDNNSEINLLVEYKKNEVNNMISNYSYKNTKIKYLLDKLNIKTGPFGSTLTGKTIDYSDYCVYSQANLISNDFTKTKNYISKEVYDTLISYYAYPNDILLSMMGTIGKCKIIPNGIKKGIIDSHIIKISLNEKIINPKYFEIIYDKDSSNIVFNQLLYESKGSIMDGLNTTIVKNLKIPLMNLDSQKDFLEKYHDFSNKIDQVIDYRKQIIEKLEEYKRSLIYECVTGKREV